ncbi:MAG: hypothetical protein Q9184_008452, partial [Pyrenodesmia sp. 2 TL-2023]
HVGVRGISRDCTDWHSWMRFSSAVLYQNHESSLEHDNAPVTWGNVDCAYSATAAVGQAADVWIIVSPEPTELVVQMWYCRCTLPEEKAQWIARLFQSMLESMPATLEQPLHRIAERYMTDVMPASVARPATIPDQPNRSGAGSQNDGPPYAPSALTRTVVWQAWDEVGLGAAEGQKKEEDGSMFSCGAALVIIMLLSRCYQRGGYAPGMQDLIDHPTQESRASLLESKKALNGKIETG